MLYYTLNQGTLAFFLLLELPQFPHLVIWVLQGKVYILAKFQPLSDKLLDVLGEELEMALFHKQKFEVG